MQAISKGIGTAEIEERPIEEAAEDWQKQLSFNLKMKASDAFKDPPEEDEEPAEEEEEGALPKKSRKF